MGRRRGSGRERPRWQRWTAFLCGTSFLWSFVLATPLQALANPPPKPRLGIRTLTTTEMEKMVGRVTNQVPQAGSETVTGTAVGSVFSGWEIKQGSTVIATNSNTNGWSVSATASDMTVSAPGSALLGSYTVKCERYFFDHLTGAFDVVQPATSLKSGSPFPWEFGFPDRQSPQRVNTINGNKMTTHPIVGWTARGGMPLQFSLVHNSQSNQNTTLGPKWTHSFDLYLIGTTDMTIHWGDDLSYTFVQNMDGSYTAPTGIWDTLVKHGNNTYTLTTKAQIKYEFNTSLRCTSIEDRNGNTITLGYSGNNVTTITDPTSRVLTLTYTSNKITSITDPLSRVWSIDYDGSGRVWKVNHPTLNSNTYYTEYTYNSANCITGLKLPRGYSWTFDYYLDNSLKWQRDPYSNQTSFNYTSTDKTITDANGNVTTLTYTSGRLTKITDPQSYYEEYTWDTGKNAKTNVRDKRGYNWAFTYDSKANVLTATDPYSNVTTYTYTGKNDVASVTIPTGEKTEYTYDTPGNLIEVDYKDEGGTLQAHEEYTVNGNGQITDFYDANGHHYEYDYDSNGHLDTVTTPDSHVTSWVYNALGNATRRTDALGRTTDYTRDAWQRVTTIDYPAGTDPTFQYDLNNNKTQMVDANGTTTWEYDNADRLLHEKFGGNTLVSYTYDATGKLGLLSTITDADSRVLTYSYTTRDQLTQVSETAGTATYTYDANGNITGITNPNGTTVTNTYDNASALTSVVNKNSSNTTLSSFSYVLNENGERESVTEADGSVVSYGYDWKRRLTSETRTGTNAYSKSYTLDDVGNRTSQTVGGTTTTFTFNDDDELTATSGGFTNSYSYNDNGEQTNRTLSGTSHTLAYDYEGQLTSITQGGNTTSFAYDALGRRFSRTSGGTTTRFHYAGSAVLLEKQGSTTTGIYTYGNGLIRRGSEYPLFDGLGSERTVTNGSETVTGTINYDSFGQTIGTTGSSSSPYMYAANSGYRTEGDAGLMQVGARYYDAQVGRFITRDTLLDQHPYLYCDHDPVNYVAPDGRQISKPTPLPPTHIILDPATGFPIGGGRAPDNGVYYVPPGGSFKPGIWIPIRPPAPSPLTGGAKKPSPPSLGLEFSAEHDGKALKIKKLIVKYKF